MTPEGDTMAPPPGAGASTGVTVPAAGQDILLCHDPVEKVEEFLGRCGGAKVLFVHTGALGSLPFAGRLRSLPGILEAAVFTGFSPNPRYEDLLEGAALWRREGCGAVVVVGGGSAIDSAKCIALFGGMAPETVDCLAEALSPTSSEGVRRVPMLAIPTTGGSGAESTPAAVLYRGGVKYSVSGPSLLPDTVILCPDVLAGLPPYQKKATVLDALCQAVESHWSVKATADSRRLAREAAALLLPALDTYIHRDPGSEAWGEAAASVMLGANRSGQAIAMTQTTAPHAMSYGLTTLGGISHGHGVALCMRAYCLRMQDHLDRMPEGGGSSDLGRTVGDTAALLGRGDARGIAAFMQSLLEDWGLARIPLEATTENLGYLLSHVNPQRLGASPWVPDMDDIKEIYTAILRG